MSRRKGVWRRTDLLAALGIVLLLIWLPMYMAQDAADREALSVSGWDMRDPLDGDRVVMDLVATDENGSQHVLPGVLEISYRRVEPGEAPRDALFKEDRVTPGVNVSVGGLRVYAEPGRQTIYYGADGQPVYSATHGTSTSVLGGTRIELDARQRTLGHVHQSRGLPTEFRHVSWQSSAAVQSELFMGKVYGNRVAHYKDQVVYAGDGEQLAADFNPFPNPDFGICGGTPGKESSSASQWWNALRIEMRYGQCTGTGWDWYVPDFPVPVGRHLPVWTAELELLEPPRLIDPVGSIDLLPASIERGDGPSLPFARTLQCRPTASSPCDQPLETNATFIALGDLESRRAPLLHGASMTDIVALLDEDEVPSTVRSLRERGAKVLAFEWRQGEPVEESEAPAPMIGDLFPTGSTIRYPVGWKLLLYASDAEWTVVDLGVWMDPAGSVSMIDADDLCEGRMDCEEDAFVTPDLESSHVAPDWFLMELGRRGVGGDDGPETAYWSGVSAGDWTYPRPTVGRLFSRTIYDGYEGLWPTVSGGVMAWQEAAQEGSGWHRFGGFNAADGSELADVQWREMDESYEATPAEPLSEAIRVIEPIPPLLFWAVALFLLSLIARGVRYILMGGHYGLFAVGYAKIARSDVLSQERRHEIMDLLGSEPGLTGTQLQERLGYGWGATIHHLETLVRAGLIVPMQNGRRRHYFPKGSHTPAERLDLAATQDPDASALLEAVRAHPGRTAGELAEQVSRSRTGVSRTASRLERMGLLEKRRDGVRVRLHVRA